MLAGIRAAVGPDVSFSADSNRGYATEEVGRFSEMAAEYGVCILEDPTELHAHGNFAAAKGASSLPLLIDNTCRSLDEAKQFLAVGAEAALGVAGAVPPHRHGLPSEESFFLQFAREYVDDPLTVENGLVRLPDATLNERIDWTRVADLTP